jgi:hypothetical protein
MRELRTAAAEHSRNFSQQKPAIGLDLGDRWSWYCALDEAGDCAKTPSMSAIEIFRREPA